jgi:DNA-binding beta-propeller fold protein YncE
MIGVASSNGTSQTSHLAAAENSTPAITGLLPGSLVAGSHGQALQISGVGFNINSVVRWNGQDRPTTLINSRTLSVQLTGADLAAPVIAEVEVFNPPAGGGSSSPVWFPTVGLSANGLAYNKTRGLLYATVPTSEGNLGNSVASIDPIIGAIGSPIFVGSEPGPIVISDDGHYLYVVLNGTGAVRRVDQGRSDLLQCP